MKLFAKREAAIVLVDGTPVVEAYGKCYRADGYVEWGSVTKLVTAHTTARLVDEGALAPDTAVVDVIGVLPRSVTVGGLVSHTSGMPRVHPGMSAGVFSDPYAGTDHDVVMAVLAQITPSSLVAPGSETYSNLGYATLGLVIEEVTGKPWFEAVDELVLRPLGLTDTSPLPDLRDRIHIKGFDRQPHQPWDLAGSPYVAAGGLWSPLSTMARYGAAVLSEPGLPDTRRGWQRRGEVAWHNGQTRDSGAFLALVPDRGAVIATHALARLPGAADRLGWELVHGLDP